MKCPFCGHENIAGTDLCENCQEDLSSIDREIAKTKIERIIMRETVSKLQCKNALTTSVNSSLEEAIKKMAQSKTGCVLIKDNKGDLKGILTERDILFKVSGKVKDLSKVKVSEVMTTNVETLNDEDTLASAMHKMAIHRFRHIPILRKGQQTGVVTALDILKYFSKALQ